jgi:multidrug efflux system membrane fusion protein
MAEEVLAADAPEDVDERERSHAHHRWIWIVIVAAVCAAIAAYALIRATSHPPRRAKPPPVQVQTVVAQEGNLPVHLESIGTVTALATAQISSQVTAQIKTIHYQEGQLVQKGTLLVELDARPFLATLAQVQGTLRRDLQVLAQARMDLDRYRLAWSKNAIPKQQLQDQEHVVLQDEGTVQNDRGAVQAARIQVDYCQVRSPIDGRVGLRLVDQGNNVVAAATTPLAVVTQLQPISVVFTVSEDNLEQLWPQPNHDVGAQVVLFDRAHTRKLATGKLDTIDNQIDTTTGTVRVRALFDNQDEALFPNQFVNAQVLVRTLQDVVLLPASAVQRDGERTFVFAIEDGHVHLQSVKVTASDGQRDAVLGILAGAEVANSSFEKLREGVEITPVHAGSAGSAAPPQPPPQREPEASSENARL